MKTNRDEILKTLFELKKIKENIRNLNVEKLTANQNNINEILIKIEDLTKNISLTLVPKKISDTKNNININKINILITNLNADLSKIG